MVIDRLRWCAARGRTVACAFVVAFCWVPKPGRAASGPSGEVGLNAEMDLKDPSQRLVGPAFRIYGAPLDDDSLPVREAAFAKHISWASLAVNLLQGSATSLTEATADMSADGIEATAELRWVVGGSPFTLTIPYSGGGYRWMDDSGETNDKLRLQTVGIEPGWYVTDSFELTAGFSYASPDFWYRSSDTDWGWLAWDIYNWWVGTRALLNLQNGTFIAVSGRAGLYRDQQGNRLVAVQASGCYYLQPAIGIGGMVSVSRFSGDVDNWGENLQAMGTTSAGILASFDLDRQWGLEGSISYIRPEKKGPDAQIQSRLELRARF